jgi:hypothetical protein
MPKASDQSHFFPAFGDRKKIFHDRERELSNNFMATLRKSILRTGCGYSFLVLTVAATFVLLTESSADNGNDSVLAVVLQSIGKFRLRKKEKKLMRFCKDFPGFALGQRQRSSFADDGHYNHAVKLDAPNAFNLTKELAN